MTNIYFQLFKRLPEAEFIDKIAQIYGIKDLDINYKFTIRDLEKNSVIERLNNLKEELNNYYLNCKFKKYVEDLTEKKSITILRHLLKVIDYKVVSHEKYSDNRKYLVYNIKNINKTFDDSELTVNFD